MNETKIFRLLTAVRANRSDGSDHVSKRVRVQRARSSDLGPVTVSVELGGRVVHVGGGTSSIV